MTRTAPAAPTICLHSDGSVPEVSAALGRALDVLVDAGRVVRVSDEEDADIQHRIGGTGAGAHTGARVVHTPCRVSPHRGRLVALATPRMRRERRRLRSETWLAHGQTACRALLEAGLASGERLYCAPLLAPDVGPRGERATLRRLLGIPPGVRLAAGALASGQHLSWAVDPHFSRRRDVASLVLLATGTGHFRARLDEGAWLADPLPLGSWLSAADVFVAADSALHACSAAVAAAEFGLPLVAASTDSAAELVLAGHPGVVVRGEPHAVAHALLTLIDESPAVSLTSREPAFPPERHLANVARAMLRCYRSALIPVRAAGS